MDSELVVGFLKTGIGESHPLSFLVRLADGLANHAFSLHLGFHDLNVAPLEIAPILREDVIGPPRPRQVRV